MKRLKKWIIEASKVANITLRQLSRVEASFFCDKIEKKYSIKPKLWPLWDNLIEDESYFRDENGWKYICDFVGKQEINIFFDDINDVYALKGSDLQALLEESPLFVFYVSDNKGEFLLCHNDSDYLIGAGEAKEWVDKLAKEKDNYSE